MLFKKNKDSSRKYKLQYSNGNFTRLIEAKSPRTAYRIALEEFSAYELLKREELGHLTTNYVKVQPGRPDKIGICTENVVNQWLAEHRNNYKKSVLDDLQLKYENTKLFRRHFYDSSKKFPIPVWVIVAIVLVAIVCISVSILNVIRLEA
nr:MAG TPA: hypothetical protein [Caudoviricetes sp.]